MASPKRFLTQARPSPLEVVARPGEDSERLIRRFTRKVRDDGVLRESMERRSFMKPSQKRRRKSRRAISGAAGKKEVSVRS